MARTRERVCTYYVRKGECSKGREAELYGICQTCKYYLPLKGARPARTDKRKQKLEKIEKKERYDY